MSRILSRLFAPVLERHVLLRAVGHVFFQSLIIASQFGVTYLVVRLIENMNRPDVFPEVMREVYIGLIGMGFLVLYLFIHCRYTTTGNVRSLLNQRVRTESIGAFLRSSGHTSGLTPTGKTISIFQEGIQSWWDMIIETIGEVLPGIVCLIASLVYLGIVDQTTLLVCIPYLIATGIGVIFSKKKTEPHYKARKQISTSMVRYFVRDILERTLIQLSRRVTLETNRIKEGGVSHTEATQHIEIYNAFSWWISRISIDVFRISAIAYIAFQVVAGTVGAGSIVIIGMVFATLNRYYDKLIQSFQFFQDEYIHLSEFWDYLDQLIPFHGLQSGNIFIPKNSGIRLWNIDFSYPNGNPVFEWFSLDISPRKITAIVGRSGGGKSTLIKLFLGTLRPTWGYIEIDGQDLDQINLESYYKYIAYLPQDPAIFDASIRENLLYSLEKPVSDEILIDGLARAECTFFKDLPHGLDTEIGERGIRLSGGERQRLAIARVLLQDPEIIFLDEPTSALDSFSEEAVTRALHTTFPGRTVVIIAHRLQTVKDADTIIVLGKNEILETGTHASLITKKGHYASMVDLQSGVLLEE